MRQKTLLLLGLLLGSLLAAPEVSSAAGSHQERSGSGSRPGSMSGSGSRPASGSMPGSPFNISTNDRGLQQVVLNATRSFNSQSNDAFLFRPSSILRAQRQIVKGFRYIVDLDISRTVCRKREKVSNLTDCVFQPEGPLQQTFRCHVEVWIVPWKHQTNDLEFLCKSETVLKLS
ncbi:cystatin-F [Scomber japonicus]|uniref:cystatin-F n=1 Tax=Scomber japonicus TaxID=13676 RepID=UPI0023069814|nr:cystatin-F [Scomber japonicus]